MATIPSQTRFPTANQNPENSILDQFNKQTYLGNSFILAAVDISLSTTNEILIALIQNVAPNTKSLFMNLRRYTSSAEQVLMKAYLNPTISTVGAATVPNNLRPANTNASVSTCYVNGNFTVSANGTLYSALGCPADYYVTLDNNILIILDPGQSLLITATALTEDTVLNSEISWYEL